MPLASGGAFPRASSRGWPYFHCHAVLTARSVPSGAFLEPKAGCERRIEGECGAEGVVLVRLSLFGGASHPCAYLAAPDVSVGRWRILESMLRPWRPRRSGDRWPPCSAKRRPAPHRQRTPKGLPFQGEWAAESSSNVRTGRFTTSTRPRAGSPLLGRLGAPLRCDVPPCPGLKTWPGRTAPPERASLVRAWSARRRDKIRHA